MPNERIEFARLAKAKRFCSRLIRGVRHEAMEEAEMHIEHSVITLDRGAMVLCLECAGVYGIGSSGKPAARRIYETATGLLDSTKADLLLLDYSRLNYKWGDDMWLTFQIDHPDPAKGLEFALVVGVDCENAIKSLLEEDGGYDSWLDAGYVFRDRDMALAHLSKAFAEQAAAGDARNARA